MSHLPKNCRLLVVALAAACLLVFQALAGSVTASAAMSALDAFGNPLCIGHIPDADGNAPAKKNTAVPDCCTVACGLFLVAAPPPAADIGLFNPLAEPAQISFGDYDLQSVVPPDYRPGYPRAPPAFT